MENQCIVCYSHYDSVTKIPRILPCGHTFCQRCLSTLARQDSLSPSQPSTIICPSCRRAAPNLNDVGKLPANSNYFRTTHRVKQSRKEDGTELIDSDEDSDDGDLEVLPGSTADYLRSQQLQQQELEHFDRLRKDLKHQAARSLESVNVLTTFCKNLKTANQNASISFRQFYEGQHSKLTQLHSILSNITLRLKKEREEILGFQFTEQASKLSQRSQDLDKNLNSLSALQEKIKSLNKNLDQLQFEGYYPRSPTPPPMQYERTPLESPHACSFTESHHQIPKIQKSRSLALPDLRPPELASSLTIKPSAQFPSIFSPKLARNNQFAPQKHGLHQLPQLRTFTSCEEHFFQQGSSCQKSICLASTSSVEVLSEDYLRIQSEMRKIVKTIQGMKNYSVPTLELKNGNDEATRAIMSQFKYFELQEGTPIEVKILGNELPFQELKQEHSEAQQLAVFLAPHYGKKLCDIYSYSLQDQSFMKKTLAMPSSLQYLVFKNGLSLQPVMPSVISHPNRKSCYLITGRQLYLFDIQNEAFLKKPVFKPNSQIVQQSYCLHEDGYIYSVGGLSLKNPSKCERFCSQFHILKEKWHLAPQLQEARFGAATCSIDSQSLITTGGQDDKQVFLNSIEILQTSRDTMHIWRLSHIKLGVPRKFHSIVSTSYERFLILGGDWSTPSSSEILMVTETQKKKQQDSMYLDEDLSLLRQGNSAAIEELDLHKQKSLFLSQSLNPPKGRVSVLPVNEELYVFGGGVAFPKKYEVLKDSWKVLRNKGLSEKELEYVLSLPMAFIEI